MYTRNQAIGKGASPSVSGLAIKGGKEYLLFLITAVVCVCGGGGGGCTAGVPTDVPAQCAQCVCGSLPPECRLTYHPVGAEGVTAGVPTGVTRARRPRLRLYTPSP